MAHYEATEIPKTSKFTKGSRKIVALAMFLLVAIGTIALLASQSEGNNLLNLNYEVGEKMEYNTITTASTSGSNPFSLGNQTIQTPINGNSSAVIDVVSFDGEMYTLNHTIVLSLG